MKNNVYPLIIEALILIVIFLIGIMIYNNSSANKVNIIDESTLNGSEDYSDNKLTTDEINKNTYETDESVGVPSQSQQNNDEIIVDEAIKNAENALKNYDYESAQRFISDAYSQVSDTSRLVSANDHINDMKPVSLLEYERLSGELSVFGTAEINTGEQVEALGVKMDQDLEAKQTLRNTLSYATNGQFESFRCNLALLNDMSKNNPLDISIEVYCDGILTYTSDTLTKGSLPVEINTDISNAQKVDIKFTVFNNNDFGWYPSLWSSEEYYAVSMVIYNAEFIPKFTPLM